MLLIFQFCCLGIVLFCAIIDAIEDTLVKIWRIDWELPLQLRWQSFPNQVQFWEAATDAIKSWKFGSSDSDATGGWYLSLTIGALHLVWTHSCCSTPLQNGSYKRKAPLIANIKNCCIFLPLNSAILLVLNPSPIQNAPSIR